MRSWVVVSTLLMLLGGCRSAPPPDFFLLTADAKPAGVATGQSIGLTELSVAEYLRRWELVSLEGGNKLYVDPYRRWAEPLDDGIRRTLLLNLSALLGSNSVHAMPWPRDWIPQWRLRCYVARLDVGAERIELVASWSLQDGGRTKPAEDHITRLSRQRSSRSLDAIAADLSGLLLELSEQIATAMGSSVVHTAAPVSGSAVE